MDALLARVGPRMPAERPRYLMGVGLPQDILRAIGHGIDLFDCVVPTRNARNGQLYTWQGPIQIRHAVHARDPRPIDPDCPCPACRRFSRAYLRHLYRGDEIFGMRLNTLHNLTFYAQLLERARARIADGSFATWAPRALAEMGCG
jgi:queuine tRNA-ribosyltransferase